MLQFCLYVCVQSMVLSSVCTGGNCPASRSGRTINSGPVTGKSILVLSIEKPLTLRKFYILSLEVFSWISSLPLSVWSCLLSEVYGVFTHVVTFFKMDYSSFTSPLFIILWFIELCRLFNTLPCLVTPLYHI